jgi:hypothetical protein
MSTFSNSSLGRFTTRGLLPAVCMAGAVLLAPQIGAAQASSPFASFTGAWRGVGQVVGTDGKHEPIRCRANYSISDHENGLSQTLVCASDSYRVDISSYLVAKGQSVQGNWQEATRKVSGHLTGQVSDGHFEGNVAGPSFTAEISLRASGRTQEVSITPHGGDVAKVEISLARDG